MCRVRPIALRVAQRHAELPPDQGPTVVYSDGGVITVDDAKRLIRDHYGIRIVSLVFRADEAADGNTIWWDATTESGKRITGRLVLHAGVASHHVVSWAELSLRELGLRSATERDMARGKVESRAKVIREKSQCRTATGSMRPKRILDEVAILGRELIRTIREHPTFSITETIAAVARIVEIAEAPRDGEG
ncbi:MAG: hypothetical protein ABSC94_30475 [Polyangiaceae bacterium]|jgi:hypothetical protein